MRIAEWLETQDVEYYMETHLAATTVDVRAQRLLVRPRQVLGAVLVNADGRLIMCAVPADREIDLAALRVVLGRGEVHPAAQSEVGRLCGGCEPGSEPPIGRLFAVPTLLDASVREEAWVFLPAGTARVSILMARADLERVSKATVAAFTRSAPAACSKRLLARSA